MSSNNSSDGSLGLIGFIAALVLVCGFIQKIQWERVLMGVATCFAIVLGLFFVVTTIWSLSGYLYRSHQAKRHLADWIKETKTSTIPNSENKVISLEHDARWERSKRKQVADELKGLKLQFERLKTHFNLSDADLALLNSEFEKEKTKIQTEILPPAEVS